MEELLSQAMGTILLHFDRVNTKDEAHNYTFYCRIQEPEAKEALKRMDNNKAVGLDDIPFEVWKSLEEKGTNYLTKLFCDTMRSNKMWRS